jgi:NAD(P)H-hydrate epimerase
MRAVDRDAIQRRGLPARLLMENAGRAAARAVRGALPDVRRPLIVCGAGNNGGDGFVLARVLREWDRRVEPCVLLAQGRAGSSEEAVWNLELLRGLDIEVVASPEPVALGERLRRADLIVDAIFGVGLSRAVDGVIAKQIAQLNEAPVRRVSLDLPSGVSADSGAALGCELEPELIVTFGLPKLGLATRPFLAPVLVADLGLPAESIAAARIQQRVLTPSAAARRLPLRPPSGHKGSFGHVLVIAGSRGKTGAAALAAEGALRAGAGLVTAAVPRGLEPILELKLTEAMTLDCDDERGGFAASSAERLLREAGSRDAVVLGPGLSGEDGARFVVRTLAGRVGLPLVIDADGLNVFEREPEALRGPGPRVLTPHPGEMSRLLGRPVDAIQRDRVGSARELARRTRAVVLLKGARSVIASPEGEVYVNPTGGPGLATGGTGDVLAGVVAALLAQQVAPFDAAVVGAYLHGRAGEVRKVGLLAGEMARHIPEVWSALAARDEREPDDDTLRPFP